MKFFAGNKVLQNISGFAFFLFFPGLFFYGYLVSKSILPVFYLGYYPVLVLTVFALSIISLFFKSRFFLSINRIDIYGYVFVIMQLSMVIISSLYYIFEIPYSYHSDIYIWIISGVVINIMMFLIGLNLSEPNQYLYWFVLLVMSIVVFFNLGDNNVFYLKLDSGNPDDIPSYQGFGRSIMMVGIVLLMSNNRYILISSVMLTFSMLIANGSRSELLFYILGVMFFLSVKVGWRYLILCTIGCFLFFVFCFVFNGFLSL